MFRTFIIDDDKYAVEATYKMFPWDDLKVGRIDKIYSAHRLTERILTEKPDMVFIDIEMNGISGLDIISECNKHGCKSLFVIISGHDNFKYAHTAVNLGVIFYLLKPIDPADVVNVTERLKNAMNKQNNDYAYDFLSAEGKLEQHLRGHLDEQKSYRLLIGVLTESKYNDIKIIVEKAMTTSFKIGAKKYLFVIQKTAFNAKMKLILDNYAIGNRLILGMSSAFDGNTSPGKCFRQANVLSYHNFINSRGAVISPTSYDTENFRRLVDSFNKAIDTREIAVAKKILSELPDIFIERNYSMVQVVLFYNAVSMRINLSGFENQSFPYPQMNEEDLYMEFQDFRGLCAALSSYLDETLTTEVDSTGNSLELWFKINDYIERNYSKKVCAQDICNALFIGTTTFYNVFKCHAKKTFVEYLTLTRIEKSKQMLMHTQHTLAEIAEAVGIGDYYYFNKVFKKHVGMTPLKYRKQSEA